MDDRPVEDIYLGGECWLAIYKINQQINHRFPPAAATGLDRDRSINKTQEI